MCRYTTLWNTNVRILVNQWSLSHHFIAQNWNLTNILKHSKSVLLLSQLAYHSVLKMSIHQHRSFKPIASVTLVNSAYAHSSVYHYHACAWTSPLSSFVIRLSNPDLFHPLPGNSLISTYWFPSRLSRNLTFSLFFYFSFPTLLLSCILSDVFLQQRLDWIGLEFL